MSLSSTSNLSPWWNSGACLRLSEEIGGSRNRITKRLGGRVESGPNGHYSCIQKIEEKTTYDNQERFQLGFWAAFYTEVAILSSAWEIRTLRYLRYL